MTPSLLVLHSKQPALNIFLAGTFYSPVILVPGRISRPPKPMSLADAKGSNLSVTRSFSNPPNDNYLVELNYLATMPPSLVPVSATVWLLVSGLAGLAAASKKL